MSSTMLILLVILAFFAGAVAEWLLSRERGGEFQAMQELSLEALAELLAQETEDGRTLADVLGFVVEKD